MNAESLPVFSLPLTFLILSTILVLRYFLLSGLMFFLVRKLISPLDKLQVKRDIRWSVLSSFVFAASAMVMIRIWQNGMSLIYLDLSEYPLWYAPISFIIYLIIQDTYFYWTHRLMHKVGFRYIHRPHHETRNPTSWTSFAFHPWEALIQSILLPLLTMWIPIHIGILGLFLILMSAFGVTNHLGTEIYPSFIEKKLGIITANHHQIHHTNLKKNFGLFFSFWDKLMGTEYTSE